MSLTLLATGLTVAGAFRVVSVPSILRKDSASSAILHHALSSAYLENDLVAIRIPDDPSAAPRLCVVRPDNTVLPLCTHEDDVETDLFADPRCYREGFWAEVSDEHVVGAALGEGWYGQRPVPSLGGGPGYGAEADEIWSVDMEFLETLENNGISLPTLDVGISHGEKARNGAFD